MGAGHSLFMDATTWAFDRGCVRKASNFYYLDIENTTDFEVLTTVQMVNDVRFQAYEGPEKWRRERAGWGRSKDIMLAPAEKKRICMPSEHDPRTGVLLLISRTGATSPGNKQYVALHIARWPWTSAREWAWPDGRIRVVLNKTDFRDISVDLMAEKGTGFDEYLLSILNTVPHAAQE